MKNGLNSTGQPSFTPEPNWK